MLSLLVHVVIGYFVGAMFSEHIFMNLSLTHWDNAWTYGWIFLWSFFIQLVIYFWAFIIGAVAFSVAWVMDRFS